MLVFLSTPYIEHSRLHCRTLEQHVWQSSYKGVLAPFRYNPNPDPEANNDTIQHEEYKQFAHSKQHQLHTYTDCRIKKIIDCCFFI
jgi:hypothetical protein